MAEQYTEKQYPKAEPIRRNKGAWALILVIIASLLLIGLPFLGPLFFIAIPVLFVLTLPALIWFLYQSKRESRI